MTLLSHRHHFYRGAHLGLCSFDVWSWCEGRWFDAAQPLPDLYSPPAGCSPVAAELNHCEHGRHSLFTCGLSPAAAQPGGEHLFLTQSKMGVFVCEYANWKTWVWLRASSRISEWTCEQDRVAFIHVSHWKSLAMWFSPVVSKITLPGIPLANRDN